MKTLNLEDFYCSNEPPIGEEISTEVSIARNKKKHLLFAKVPLEEAAKAAKVVGGRQMMVWIVLLHLSWKEKSTTVVLSNQVLAKYGISREIKRKAIANLASAGLIAIADRGRGRSPQITLMPSARAGRLPR